MKRLDAYKVYLFLEGAGALLFAAIFTANLIYQVEVAHLTPLQLVLVGTALELSVFIFEVPTGIVADLYSRRLSIVIGHLVMGLGFILEGSIPLFLAIMLSQAVWGLGYTFTSGATQAWISDEIGEAAAGRAFLRGSQVGKFASLAGIGLGVVLGSLAINLPMIAGGAGFLLLGVFLALIMPETGFTPTHSTERESWGGMASTFKAGLAMIQRRPALYIILAIGLFYGLYSEGYDRLWTKLMLDNFQFPTLAGLQPVFWFGLLRAAGSLVSIAATEVVHRRLDMEDTQAMARFLVGLTGALILALLAFAWSGSLLIAALLVLTIGTLRSLIHPVYTAWVNRRLDSRVRATVLSMSGKVDAIGQIAGGPAIGWIGEAASVRVAISVSAAILSPALILYARALGRPEAELQTGA